MLETSSTGLRMLKRPRLVCAYSAGSYGKRVANEPESYPIKHTFGASTADCFCSKCIIKKENSTLGSVLLGSDPSDHIVGPCGYLTLVASQETS